MTDQKERLKKLYALAMRGVGGEKETAQAILDKLLKKYAMTIDDLDEEVIQEYELEYHGKEQDRILMQTVYKVTDEKDTFNHLQYTHSGRACRTRLRVRCTAAQKAEKVNCLTLKQDRWANSGLIEYKGFCRYLTTRELEQAQTLPVGYTRMLTKAQAENVLGDCWTVDVIAHIFSGLKEV